tara:strand:+ start:43126 stop:44124 length:999 start_codon:yes stop_codon:yes gene_type:complete
VTKATDKVSIAISGIITGAVILLGVALFQTVENEKPRKQKLPKPTTTVEKPSQKRIAVIQLPPPPKQRRKAAKVSAKPKPSQSTRPISALRPTADHAERQAPITKRVFKPLKPAAKKRLSKSQKPAGPPKQAKKTDVKKNKTTPVKVFKRKVVATSKHKRAGRILLRMLEHGRGPSVEIAWPQSASRRLQLYTTLRHCYGMQAAVLHRSKALFSATDPPGVSWKLNIDRFSGFLRSPQGAEIIEESALFRNIARRHNLEDWSPVRVFPRSVDAILLGGLEQLVGGRYSGAKRIQARYNLSSRGLSLQDIRVDGSTMAGSVGLPISRGPNCRV